jgi:hypothetical protein
MARSRNSPKRSGLWSAKDHPTIIIDTTEIAELSKVATLEDEEETIEQVERTDILEPEIFSILFHFWKTPKKHTKY